MSRLRPKPGPEDSSQAASVCYLSVDGLTDPLGRSQVLPYLTRLARRGHSISLLSLEKPERFAATSETVRSICEEAGIDWIPLAYRSKPPLIAGAWNVRKLGRAAAKLHRGRRFDLVHARSDLASLAARPLLRKGGARFLYDMRALWPDERVDGGAWPQSNAVFRAIYRKFKRHQAEFIKEADAVVCLTSAARTLIEEWPGREEAAPVRIIPCSTDFTHFELPSPAVRAAARQELAIAHCEKVVTYVGSIGSWYMLDEMLDFFATYRQRHPGARFLIVTPDHPEVIRGAARGRGLEETVIIRSARREQVPAMLAASDLGIFFIRPVPSKRVSCPTKLGEMLAAGLPVLANSGVGDVADILRETGGGVTIERFDAAAYWEAIDKLERLDHAPEAVRLKAREWFDVEKGADSYDCIYRELVKRDARR